jgi:hypothetical protein
MMESSMEKIKKGVINLEMEVNALNGGVKTAALRGRKEALSLKNEMHELRKHISEHVKTLPVKSTKNTIVFPEPIVPDKPETVEAVEPVVPKVVAPKLVMTKLKKKKVPSVV